MPSFSPRSQARLDECHPQLRLLFEEVVKHFDCSIIAGQRGKHEQDAAFASGKSRLPWPKSKHNHAPSLAVDVAPYIPGQGISWDARQCTYFAGWVMAMAEIMGVGLRWGGDWDGDRRVGDQSFNDLVHFELVEGS